MTKNTLTSRCHRCKISTSHIQNHFSAFHGNIEIRDGNVMFTLSSHGNIRMDFENGVNGRIRIENSLRIMVNKYMQLYAEN